jgi:hypothetical protein
MICYVSGEDAVTRTTFAKILTIDFARETLTMKTEHALANLKNFQASCELQRFKTEKELAVLN